LYPDIDGLFRAQGGHEARLSSINCSLSDNFFLSNVYYEIFNTTPERILPTRLNQDIANAFCNKFESTTSRFYEYVTTTRQLNTRLHTRSCVNALDSEKIEYAISILKIFSTNILPDLLKIEPENEFKEFLQNLAPFKVKQGGKSSKRKQKDKDIYKQKLAARDAAIADLYTKYLVYRKNMMGLALEMYIRDLTHIYIYIYS